MEYLDSIMVDVMQGSEGEVRFDFLYGLVKDRYMRVIPKQFHNVRTIKAPLQNRTYNLPEDSLGVIAVNDTTLPVINQIFLYENEYFYDKNYVNVAIQDYVLGDNWLNRVDRLNKYTFTEGAMNNSVAIYTDKAEVLIFYHSMYATPNGRIVVPEFAVPYLKEYGRLVCQDLSLNNVLHGKKPVSAVQTRKYFEGKSSKVTREFMTMQHEINMQLEDVIIKPVEYGV